jgi:hypothetical protein
MRRSAWLGTVGFAGVIVAVAACSSNSAPGDKYPAVGDFCKAKAQAECQAANFCEVDQPTCVTARTQDCNTFTQALLAKGRAYVPGNAPKCVDLATSTYATNSVKDPSTAFATLEDTCNRVFGGAVAKNAACSSDYDCTGSLICDKGFCGEKTVVKNAGDGCANPGEVCDVGLYCTGTPARCTPKLVLNQPCSATAPCVESAYCSGGTCIARVPVGSACALTNAAACALDPGTPCVTSDDCATSFCDAYNPSGAKCGTVLTFSVGEPTLCSLFSQPGTVVSTPVPDAGAPAADAASE